MRYAVMARPLRIDLLGTWYHVMNRGHRGGSPYRKDTDRRRLLGKGGPGGRALDLWCGLAAFAPQHPKPRQRSDSIAPDFRIDGDPMPDYKYVITD